MKKKVISIVLAAAMPLSAIGGLNCFASTEGKASLDSLRNFGSARLLSAMQANGDSNLTDDEQEGWEIKEDSSESINLYDSSSESEGEELSEEEQAEEEEEEDQAEEDQPEESSTLRRGISNLKEHASNASKKVSDKFSSLKQGVSNASKKACNTISTHKLETALCVGGIALAAGTAYSLYRINSRLNDLYELTGNKNYEEEVCNADGVQAKLENFKGLTKAGFISAASKTKSTFANLKDSAKDGLTSAASKTKNTFVSLKDSAKNKASAIFEAMKAKRIDKANKKLREFYGLNDKVSKVSEECPNIKEKVCKTSSLRNLAFKTKNWVVNNISGKLGKNNSNEGQIAQYSINKNNNNLGKDKIWTYYQIGNCYCACSEE